MFIMMLVVLLSTIFIGIRVYMEIQMRKSPLKKVAKKLNLKTQNLSLSPEEMKRRGLDKEDIDKNLSKTLSKTPKL